MSVSESGGQSRQPPLNGRRILVIEDEYFLAEDICSVLRGLGADIIGPVAKSRGFKSLRNMANPADASALAPQPTHYSQLTPGMDPHYTSGPPNLAFYTACTTFGDCCFDGPC